jgi:hypothetical protein
MNLSPYSSHCDRPLILLAPFGVRPTPRFVDIVGDRRVYDNVLKAMQRFRGEVYVSEGNLDPAELSSDGRHVQAADSKSWHLLTLNEHGSVAACGRLVLHPRNAGFADLLVSHSALAHSEAWGCQLRRAMEERIQSTRARGIRFAEMGGWAVARDLRCTTEAVRLVMAGYALGQALGGVAGISAANAENESSSILRRVGGTPLMAGDAPFPVFYEPQYRRKVEILCLDSFRPNPRYETWIEACRAVLERVTVICSSPGELSHKQNRMPEVHVSTLDLNPAGFSANYPSH